jgi:hypothetical protein
MARYTRELLAPLHARLEAQAELIGAFRERLAAAEAKIAELEPQTPNGAPPAESWPERRAWWRRLLWG